MDIMVIRGIIRAARHIVLLAIIQVLQFVMLVRVEEATIASLVIGNAMLVTVEDGRNVHYADEGGYLEITKGT